ncbi:MAG: glycerol-3-phosphate 1-O-acyltransferase PlsY [Verrucomicrobia bacterium]|nr:glycerol-3-phosphate 1-O-acyltransferase PlsY [Verrucomicrobiota bacterium]
MVTVFAAYLLGSVPTGFLAGKARGLDIRTVGSGNIGATNVFRTLGKAAGAAVLLVDAAKGFFACWLVVRIAFGVFGGGNSRVTLEALRVVAGVAAILGHNYTCWLGFKGGKGVATTAGVLLALFPLAFAIGLGVWLAVFALGRIVSLASIAAAVALPVAVWVSGGSGTLIAVAGALGALAIFKHKANIQRLLNGTEHRFGRKKTEEASSEAGRSRGDAAQTSRESEPPHVGCYGKRTNAEETRK